MKSIIDEFVPLKNKESGLEKHLSKEAILKIAYKQTMSRVYKRIGKDED